MMEVDPDDKFKFDQPWKPVSYFEEEDEATGGNASGTAYSPSKLASLFETNKLAIDQDISMRKRLNSQLTSNEPVLEDSQDLGNQTEYTVELEDSIKILDTAAINRKAIYSDIDLLRRWRESVDNPNNDVFINDFENNHVGDIKENEGNMDSNTDYILSSLPDISDFSTDRKSYVGKKEGIDDQQLIESDDIIVGTINSDIMNSSSFLEKRSSFGGNAKVIMNDILPSKVGEISVSTVSHLNKKNLEDESHENIENSTTGNFNIGTVASDEIISDDLDDLFDDPDDTFALPVLTQHSEYVSSKDGTGLENMDCIIANNSTNIVKEAGTADINTISDEVSTVETIDDILSSNATGNVDTLIDIAEAITTSHSDVNTDNSKSDMIAKYATELNQELSCIENEQLPQEKLRDSTEVIVDSERDNLNEKDVPGKKTVLESNLDSASGFETEYERNTSDELPGVETSQLNLDAVLPTKIETKDVLDVNTELVSAESDTGAEIDTSSTQTWVMEVKSEATVDIEAPAEIKSENDCSAKDKISTDNPNAVELANTSNIETVVDTVNKIDESNIIENTDIDSKSGSYSLEETLDSIIASDCIEPVQESDDVIDKNCAISKTVDVSSVYCKDSIGCLTPDDNEEEAEIVVALSGSQSRDDNIDSDETLNSDCNGSNHNKEDSDFDQKNNKSNETTNNNSSQSIITGNTGISEGTLTLSSAASTIDSSVTTNQHDIINPDNAGQLIYNIEEEETAGIGNMTPTSDHTSNDLISDQELTVVPALSNEIVSTLTSNDNYIQDEPVMNNSVVESPSIIGSTSDTPDVEAAESFTHSRSSGSIRRVRFSLNDEDNPPVIPSTSNATSSAANSDDTLTSTNQQAEMTLGIVAPTWIPDSDAKSCMMCNAKFTVVKRRHHCRACGKVLCSQCCNMKFHLPYMDYKPARVCQTCANTMINALNLHSTQNDDTQTASLQQQPALSPSTPSTNSTPDVTLPEAPPPYSESLDGLNERVACGIAPPYTEMHTPQFNEQPAQVSFASQSVENLPVIRNSSFPNTNITDMMNFQLPSYSSNVRARASRHRSESEMSAVIMFNSTVTNLPPVLRRENEETRIVNNPNLDMLMKKIYDEEEDPVSFIVNKNLVVRVKIVDLDCCIQKKCWCFVSDGMGASNQEEVVILIRCESYDLDDWMLARKVLQQMNAIFEKAKHGNAVSDSEQIEFNPNITCMSHNVGMLFYKSTQQCLKKLFLPTSPYLFGLYILKSEVPWARNFPLRLLLRIGAEFKYYPCPLFNVLDRPPVYDGVGRTILDLLADFRNYQYTLPRIVGVTINLRGKDTILKLPRHRFDEVLKAVNAAEENVLSLAGNFSPSCDGHLVSVEKDGCHKTQTLSIVLKEHRKVTCASFFVMSAALKTDSSGIKAKASIVEDGVMVQVTADVIQEFKTAIKEMKEYSVVVGNPNAEDSSLVNIEWCTGDSVDRPKSTSPIDATPFDNLTNMKIRHSYDYTSSNLTAKIHWVEVYFLPHDNDTTVQRLSARELGQMTSSIAKACMSALSPHLMTLIALEMTRIGLRVNLAANFVEYKIGSNLASLPAELLPTLDDKLVPAVHNVMSSAQERVAVELIFQLVKIV